MMTHFIYNLRHGWGFMRILRLSIGLLVGYNGILEQDYLLMFIATVLLYQAVWNTGCGMGNNSCTIPGQKSQNSDELSEDH